MPYETNSLIRDHANRERTSNYGFPPRGESRNTALIYVMPVTYDWTREEVAGTA